MKHDKYICCPVCGIKLLIESQDWILENAKFYHVHCYDRKEKK